MPKIREGEYLFTDKNEEDDAEDQVVKIKGNISHQKKVESMVDERSREGQITIFDKKGDPIKKIGKEFPAIDVFDRYLRQRQSVDGEVVLDMNSENGIFGIEYGRLNPKSQVNISVNTSIDAKRASATAKNLDANSLSNVKMDFTDQALASDVGHGIEKHYSLVIYENQWSDNCNIIQSKIADVWSSIQDGGKFIIMMHKKSGANKMLDYLKKLGMEAEFVTRGRGGFRLIEIVKASGVNVEKIDTRKTISFNFHGKDIEAFTDKAVFSSDDLDEGTRFLLDIVFKENAIKNNNEVIGDIGSGWGAIPLVIGSHMPKNKIVAFENNTRSIQFTRDNLAGTDVIVEAADFADEESHVVKKYRGQIDCIISNPPFHVSENEREGIFKNMKRVLRQGGSLWFVVEESFSARFKDAAGKNFSILKEFVSPDGKYKVFQCSK